MHSLYFLGAPAISYLSFVGNPPLASSLGWGGNLSYRSVVVSRMVVSFSLLIFSSNPISRVEFSSSRLDV